MIEPVTLKLGPFAGLANFRVDTDQEEIAIPVTPQTAAIAGTNPANYTGGKPIAELA